MKARNKISKIMTIEEFENLFFSYRISEQMKDKLIVQLFAVMRGNHSY